MAEKLTPTFVIKLVVLFALLLTGVFFRTNKMGVPADAAEVHLDEQPSKVNNVQQQEKTPYHKVADRAKPNSPAI
ncbi:hypothetical protein [Pontibacter cellulosilyticus]|uniref:Uncharacterized protein n=1 Tax=Pontibacter cellulosilyticus TaxID=1720253 RepID=A0A923N5Z4_9BACT|nr:hypothetical protein [Pontibacter cellulosilyticus]MBC5993238.1 hypothetical protein [Pontibacter cellulosilyticus]